MTATFTPYLGSPVNTYLILIGCADGSLISYDQKNQRFLDNGAKKWSISGEIGSISCKNNTVVLGSSTGTIVRYAINNGKIYPEDSTSTQTYNCNGGIVSLSLDELNQEGVIGTNAGILYYVNLVEKILIKIVQKVSPL